MATTNRVQTYSSDRWRRPPREANRESINGGNSEVEWDWTYPKLGFYMTDKPLNIKILFYNDILICVYIYMKLLMNPFPLI